MTEHKAFVFLGAGEANLGIAALITRELTDQVRPYGAGQGKAVQRMHHLCASVFDKFAITWRSTFLLQ